MADGIRAPELLRAERRIREVFTDQNLDFASMHAVSNIYRAASAIRNHIEREVLSDYNLSWAGFTILFVLRVWGPLEVLELASECGLAKATVTGIVVTLETSGLVQRKRLTTDKRRVEVGLTRKGRSTIERVFPKFNQAEGSVTSGLSKQEKHELAEYLRSVIRPLTPQ